MLWTSINSKLRHLWKIVLTYVAYESNISITVSYLNYLPVVALPIFLGLYI